MSTLTISLPEELKKRMDTLPELNWSEAIRTFLQEKVKRELLLRKLDKMFEDLPLTEADCLKLGEKIKESMYKKHKAKGW